MFDYVARAHSRGWATIVADPHGEDCPHRHLQRLFELLPPQGDLLAVAHSYGAPCTLGFLKAVPRAQKRLKGLALTDGVQLNFCSTRWPCCPVHTAPLVVSFPYSTLTISLSSRYDLDTTGLGILVASARKGPNR